MLPKTFLLAFRTVSMSEQLNSNPEGQDASEYEVEMVPLHIAERNLLLNNPFQSNNEEKLGERMLVATMMDEGVYRDCVIFPSAVALEAMVKTLPSMEDSEPQTRRKVIEIRDRALVKVKRKDNIRNFTPSTGPSTSRKVHLPIGESGKHCADEEFFASHEERGYCDSFDWDSYHSLNSNFTFSRRRHYERMKAMMDMPEVQTGLPLEDAKLPFQMDTCELYERVGGARVSFHNKKFGNLAPNDITYDDSINESNPLLDENPKLTEKP